MATDRIGLGSLISLGFQRMVLNNSTAQALNSTIGVQGLSVLDISIETNKARFRADGTDPTLNTGVVLQVDTTYRLHGAGYNNFSFQRNTGTCVLNIMGYKHPGD
jgi:hypothetical protein